MKKTVILLTLIIAVITGCRRNDNQLSGKLTYKGAITGIEYKANGAYIGLYIDSDLDFLVYSTFADSDGNYSFYPVDKGDYYVYSSITIAGILYEKLSTVSIKANSTLNKNLLLE
jgi:hypothetical protein